MSAVGYHMGDLSAFLRARLDEDEEGAQGVMDSMLAGDPAVAEWQVRIIRAQRAVLAIHALSESGGRYSCPVCITDREGYAEEWLGDDYPCQTLRYLATVYWDHPDYQQEWRPRPNRSPHGS